MAGLIKDRYSSLTNREEALGWKHRDSRHTLLLGTGRSAAAAGAHLLDHNTRAVAAGSRPAACAVAVSFRAGGGSGGSFWPPECRQCDSDAKRRHGATPKVHSQVLGWSQVPAMHLRTVRRRGHGHSKRTSGKGRGLRLGVRGPWAPPTARGRRLRWPSAAAQARCPPGRHQRTFLSPRSLLHPRRETSRHLVSAIQFGWMATGKLSFISRTTYQRF